MQLILPFALAHMMICLLFLILRVKGLIRCRSITLFVAFLLPVWGFLMLLVTSFPKNHLSAGPDSAGSSWKRHTSDDGLRLRISMDKDTMVDLVIPLEEALVLNSSGTRRELIMNILYADPSDYIPQLSAAKTNDDTEVVHYAVTALVEMQKDYDMRMQKLEAERASAPDDPSFDSKFLNFLEAYIGSGLLTGDSLKKMQTTYRDLLSKKLRDSSPAARWPLLQKKADTDLKLKDTAALREDINLMRKSKDGGMEVYRWQILYAMLKKDRAYMQRILTEIQKKHMYLTPELRQLVEFWGG